MGSTVSAPKPENWIEAPDVPNIPIHEFIFNRVTENIKNRGDGIWVRMADTNKEIKFSEVERKVKAVASWLTKQGFVKGDFAVFYSTNKADYFIIAMAVWMCGGIVAPMNFDALTVTLAKVLKESNAVCVVCDENSFARVIEAKKLCESVRNIVVMGNVNEPNDGNLVSIRTIYSEDGLACPDHVDIDFQNDIAYMPFSSGTTGKPKGIMHSYRTLSVLLHSAPPLPSSDLKLMFRNWAFHISGMIGHLVTLIRHHTAVFMENHDDDDERFFRTVGTEKPDVLYVCRPQLVRLMRHLDLTKHDFSSVKILGMAGCNITPEWEELIKQRLPQLRLITHNYGLTECFVVALLDHSNSVRPRGTIGRATSLTEVKIRDPDTRQRVPNGQVGEIWVRSCLLMKGYWKNPEGTAASIVDGWFRTGDLGYMDDEGNLFFKERLKELIKCYGFHVLPQELESIIHLHPAVADVGVVGKPDELAGELPVAFVVKKMGADVTNDEIIQFVSGQVTRREQLSGGVRFTDAIPRNQTGKILRRDLLMKLKEQDN